MYETPRVLIDDDGDVWVDWTGDDRFVYISPHLGNQNMALISTIGGLVSTNLRLREAVWSDA